MLRKMEKRLGHIGLLAPKDILGWRTEIIDGVRKLTQLRLMEQVVETDGKYGEKIVKQMGVLELMVDMKSIEKTIKVNINYMMKER